MRIDLGHGDDVAARGRAATSESVVLVIGAAGASLWLAQAKATIGPLAIELAPERRINVVIAGQGADDVDVDAAVAFLDRATSTTGQVLTVGGGSAR